VAKLGRKLIWLHTYAERFRDSNQTEEVPIGQATTIKGVSSIPAEYPNEYSYDAVTQEIMVGDGRFGPVSPTVWEFEVSGLRVIPSWLGYRMKNRSGKKSSPLDSICPEHWTARMSDELLELIWVLEATLAMEPELESVLDEIVTAPCFTVPELPTPTPEQRNAPKDVSTAGGLLGIMGLDDDEAGDEDGG
jgi:hypothetical protein